MDERILFVAPNLRVSNGVTTFLMNHYPYLLNAGNVVDFLLLYKVESPYIKYIQENGGQIFQYPNNNKYSIENYRYVKEVINKNKYSIIHINTSGMFAYWALIAADRLGVEFRIYHSHNPKENTSLKGIVRECVFDFLCFRRTTHFAACTDFAGRSVFGKRKFFTIKNGIDFSRFKFNQESRNDIRKRLGIEDKKVIGTVCRQADQKNPLFIVDIINELQKINENYVLLWIGSGSMINETKNYIESMGMNENVLFLGDKEDVDCYYSAMDTFLLPSKYEGLGIVYMEAQASGLLCFASDVVPRDTNLTGRIIYYSLQLEAKQWAINMDSRIMEDEDFDRLSVIKNIKSSEFNLNRTSKELIAAYIDINRR